MRVVNGSLALFLVSSVAGCGGSMPSSKGETPADPPSMQDSAGLEVTWDFPGLIKNGEVALFPTYLAHLFGQSATAGSFVFETACATISGPEQVADVTVTFPQYGAATTKSVEVGPVPSRTCVNPVFDLTQLYSLRAQVAGRIGASVRAADGHLSSASKDVTIMPADDVSWASSTVGANDLKDLSVVFATPHDPAVESLLTAVQTRSVFPKGFGHGPYIREAFTRTSNLQPAETQAEFFYLEPGETLTWALQSVTGGEDNAIDVMLFTQAQYSAWQSGTGGSPVALWQAQVTGAYATRGSKEGGQFVLVLGNPSTSASPRSVQWQRTPTRAEIVADTLQAIFNELKARSTTYVNVSLTYFAGAQHIKRASEVLSTKAANCIDGTLLFASVVELIGMEPLVVTKTGHAYVAVRTGPGSPYMIPIETTMVQSDSAQAAFATGSQELSQDIVSDPNFHVSDVTVLRSQGLTPVPH